MKTQYYECQNCGQTVQGFNAMQQIDCCDKPDFVEIHGPEAQHLLSETAAPDSALTKSGNYRKA